MFYDIFVKFKISDKIQIKLNENFNLQNEKYDVENYYLVGIIQVNYPDELWELQSVFNRSLQLAEWKGKKHYCCMR